MAEMTDEELGRKIWDHPGNDLGRPNPTHGVWFAALGRTARELLTPKPVATREDVEKHRRDWLANTGIDGVKNIDWGLSLLSHFAPDRPRMQIEGMTVNDLLATQTGRAYEMPNAAGIYKLIGDVQRDCMTTVAMLANTPAQPDPDAEAKRLALEFTMLGSLGALSSPTADDNWNCIGGEQQRFWRRAVAKGVRT
jgi:hypothetical protein